jgi:hypothetical protein
MPIAVDRQELIVALGNVIAWPVLVRALQGRCSVSLGTFGFRGDWGLLLAFLEAPTKINGLGGTQ